MSVEILFHRSVITKFVVCSLQMSDTEFVSSSETLATRTKGLRIE